MDRSALGNLLVNARYTFVCEVELLQDREMLQSRENSVSQEKNLASLIRIEGKQSLMFFVLGHTSFVETMWRESASWRNAGKWRSNRDQTR